MKRRPELLDLNRGGREEQLPPPAPRPVKSLKVAASPTLTKRVAETLRNAIAHGELEAGERLVERILCERMGISRTSLREALRELENEGLVSYLPNRGVIISTLSIHEARAIFEVRAALEALICGLFCRKATDSQLEDCRRRFEDVTAAYRSDAPRDMIVEKSRLYEVLMAGAKNEVAERMLRSVHIRVSQLRILSLSNSERRQVSLQELDELKDAILKRDAGRAEAASRLHVERAAEAALRRLE
jgi:DNA-binding GntR family transcriptional regulator